MFICILREHVQLNLESKLSKINNFFLIITNELVTFSMKQKIKTDFIYPSLIKVQN